MRLHYMDCSTPTASLEAALAHARQHPQLAFVMYSCSYGREIKTSVDQEYMDWLAGQAAAAAAKWAPST